MQPSHTCCQGHIATTAVGSVLQVKNVTTSSVEMFILLTDCDITITIQEMESKVRHHEDSVLTLNV